MTCKYAEYDNVSFRPKIKCKANFGIETCIHQKLCLKRDGFIPTLEMGDCYIMKESEKRNIPSGSSYVRFVKNKYAYVEIEPNTVTRIKDTIGTIGNYVFVKKKDDGTYEISLFPFVEEEKEFEGVSFQENVEKKSNTTKKRKTVSNKKLEEIEMLDEQEEEKQ